MSLQGFSSDKLRLASPFSRLVADTIDLITLDGWLEVVPPTTWTYASATTVTVVGYTPSDYHSLGDKVRLKQGGSYKYFYITGISGQTLTLLGGSDYTVANSAITDIAYSKVETPLDFPHRFNWSPTLTGFSVDPSNAVYNFFIKGPYCIVSVRQATAGTSNATNFLISSPITALTLTNAVWGVATHNIEDNGAQVATGRVTIGSGGSTLSVQTSAGGNFTAANGKRASFDNLIYPYG